jgi:periplasmic protein CpxP/Spy
MMKLTKFFAAAVLLTGLIFSASAQDFGKKTPEERAQKRADKMKKHLSLSDEQYKSVYDAILSQAQQIDALKSQDLDKSKKREQIKSLRQNTDESIKGFLNKDQLTKYDKFKEKRKEKHMQKKKMKKNKKNNKKQSK